MSDSQVRSKLSEIADYFCTRLWLTSGDRNWGTTSLVSNFSIEEILVKYVK